MVLGSVSDTYKVLDNSEGTNVQTMANSEFGLYKLLWAQRDVEWYSELMKTLICARSEVLFLLRTCIGRVKKVRGSSKTLKAGVV